MKTLIALAGSLLAAGAASAAFLEAEVQTPDDYSWEFGNFSTENKVTATIYLAGLAEGTSVLSIFGLDEHPMTIMTDDPAGFFNGTDFGQGSAPPSSALFESFPSLQWDSWGTIQMTPDIAFTPGFPDIYKAGGGNNIIDNTNCAWYDNDPGTPEYEVNGRVLIGQLTWTWSANPQPDYDAIFKVSVQYGDGSFEYYPEFEGHAPGFEWNILTVPSPGALALLGLAGLVGRRRR
jgi:hypothetical protein